MSLLLKIIREVLGVKQAPPSLYENLCAAGEALRGAGRHAEAQARFREAAALFPGGFEAHNGMGLACQAAGRTAEAEAAFRRAVALAPAIAPLHYNLGNVVRAQGRLEEAAACFRQALEAEPALAPAREGLARALADLGRADEAEPLYRQALQEDPQNSRLHFLLGNLLHDAERLAEAEHHFRRAAEIQPDFLEARSNLGMALGAQGNYGGAEACYRELLAHRPDNAVFHYNLGNALLPQGRVEAAIAAFEQAAALRPDWAEPRSNRLLAANYAPRWSEEQIFAAHREFGAWLEQETAPSKAAPPASATPVRVGYVSADFREHSVAYFIEPILRHHDRRQFEIYCYDVHGAPDAVSRRLMSTGHQWVACAGMSDDALWDRIRRDGVGILVDLAGHTAGNRLRVFARRAAPIQASYLGYPNTTGLFNMDYRITDGVADPAGEADRLGTETLARLPGSYFCYRPAADAPQPGPSPALAQGFVSFGCFGNFAKIHPELLRLWARILRGVPRSCLILKAQSLADPALRKAVLDLFEAEGVAPERIGLSAWVSTRHAHLSAYREVDIALDTHPYGGAATTCEALWMGVPVITWPGRRHASRMGASILRAAGLEAWIAEDADGYARIGQTLAADLPTLAEWRNALRPRLAASPLLDGARFVGGLENLYRSWLTNESNTGEKTR